MKIRFAVVSILALFTIVIVAPAALAARPGDGDAAGPLCADISGGAGVYDSTAHTVDFRMETYRPSCASVTYAVTVYEADGTTFLAQQSQRGDGNVDPVFGPALFFHITGVSATQTGGPCVIGTTSISGHQIDVAPDSGCFSLAVGQGGRFH